MNYTIIIFVFCYLYVLLLSCLSLSMVFTHIKLYDLLVSVRVSFIPRPDQIYRNVKAISNTNSQVIAKKAVTRRFL